jgi:CheY-like chemotaxis protein
MRMRSNPNRSDFRARSGGASRLIEKVNSFEAILSLVPVVNTCTKENNLNYRPQRLAPRQGGAIARQFTSSESSTGKSGCGMSSIRVLVVEDFAPFLEFICSTLRKESRFRIIGEVSDGLEAVRQAEELKPDLILLDIGLPTLSGFDAARQIRKLAPESKIVFLTQESSADVLQEALNLGARGYVVKIRAATDLLAAVDAVVEGRQFVSGGLSGQHFTDTNPRPPADY